MERVHVFVVASGPSMKGVLLIAPLDDVSISKSTAAERRLLDFSGGLFFGYLFCTNWLGQKNMRLSSRILSVASPNEQTLFGPIKFQLKHVQLRRKDRNPVVVTWHGSGGINDRCARQKSSKRRRCIRVQAKIFETSRMNGWKW